MKQLDDTASTGIADDTMDLGVMPLPRDMRNEPADEEL